MLEIKKVENYQGFEKIEKLAYQILPVAYKETMPPEHVEFMIEKYHAAKVTSNAVARYYLLVWNQEIVGYLGLEHKSFTEFLSKLYILPDFQGKGIGQQVLNFVEKQAEYPIELVVQEENVSAIAFYKKNGFEVKEKVSHTFENAHTLHGYLMYKPHLK